MRDGAEVIVHSQDGGGRVRCTAYRDLRLANPVFIVLAAYGSREAIDSQQDIASALHAELTGPMGASVTTAACGGSVPDLGQCHARHEHGVEKLLVLVGDDHSLPTDELVRLSADWARNGWPILPLFPWSGQGGLSSRLPVAATPANAHFWKVDAAQTLPAVMATANITTRQPRIFISYRQIDSAALAIQLFDALSHAGFDVFLDHFRIPPGVNFQSRLSQELGDKSMVLLLESERLDESQWVAHEIAVAKACGLGLLGLLLPGGQPQASLEPENRRTVPLADFAGRQFDKDATLLPAALERIVQEIKQTHDRALVARRRMIEHSFEGAVYRRTGTLPHRSRDGAFKVTGGGKTYQVWLSPYPPDTPDFHRAHGKIQHLEDGVVIGLSRLMEPAIQTRTMWLADLCKLHHVDEGQIAKAAQLMLQGKL